MNPVYCAILDYMRETNCDESLASLTDEQVVHRMFANHRGERGMRLTEFGLQMMQCCFVSYAVAVPQNEVLRPKHLIALDNSSPLPYFFDKKRIVVFDHALGVKLCLVGGRLSMLLEIES